MRKIITVIVVTAIIAMLIPTIAYAAQIASQTVTFQVASINNLSVSGNPQALVISASSDGLNLDSATDATTTYNFMVNSAANKKITASINADMPTETSLRVTLSGVGSTGPQTLSTSTVDVVTGLNKTARTGQAITYVFSATVAAGEISSTSRTVTLTVTAQ